MVVGDVPIRTDMVLSRLRVAIRDVGNLLPTGVAILAVQGAALVGVAIRP
jgi:hypothetical protein